MTDTAKVPIVGVGPDGLAGLTARSRDLLTAAEVVFGSEPTLRLLPELTAERVRIGADLPEVVERLRASSGKRRVAIVAGGDPLFYGTARYLCDKVGAGHFRGGAARQQHAAGVRPASRRRWEEAYLTDLSATPLDDVLDKIRTAETVGLFTSERVPAGPGRPRAAGPRHRLLPRRSCARTSAARTSGSPRASWPTSADMRFDPLNVLILKRKPDRPDRPRAGGQARAGSATRTTCSPRAGRRPG